MKTLADAIPVEIQIIPSAYFDVGKWSPEWLIWQNSFGFGVMCFKKYSNLNSEDLTFNI